MCGANGFGMRNLTTRKRPGGDSAVAVVAVLAALSACCWAVETGVHETAQLAKLTALDVMRYSAAGAGTVGAVAVVPGEDWWLPTRVGWSEHGSLICGYGEPWGMEHNWVCSGQTFGLAIRSSRQTADIARFQAVEIAYRRGTFDMELITGPESATVVRIRTDGLYLVLLRQRLLVQLAEKGFRGRVLKVVQPHRVECSTFVGPKYDLSPADVSQVLVRQVKPADNIVASANLLVQAQNEQKRKEVEVKTAKLEAERITALNANKGATEYMAAMALQDIAEGVKNGKVQSVVVPYDFKGIINVK